MLGLQSLLISLTYSWIISKHPSRRHTFISVTILAVRIFIQYLNRKRDASRAKASWMKPREHQERLLLDILKKNGDTEYGRRYGMREVKSLEEFRRRHPLTTYEHYRSYVERMMDGESNVLTGRPPTSFIRTTGTTGLSKYIPLTSKAKAFRNIGTLLNLTLFENFPALNLMQKQVFFYVSPAVSQTKNNTLIETIDTFPGSFISTPVGYATPQSGFYIGTTYEANYIHLLFGFLDSDVTLVVAGFLYSLRTALQQLDQCWRDILHDMEHGTINSSLGLQQDVRVSLTKALKGGDPQRADELRREFQKGSADLLKRIWPRLQVVMGADQTGIWPQIEETWGKGIPFLPIWFGCSECFYCPYLALESMAKHGFVPLPHVVLVEFIKSEDTDQSQPQTYFLDEVEVGQCYEVVLTHEYFGFYRYRLGDIFRVVGFYENCPILQFQYRMGQVLNLVYEKLNQGVVDEAMKAAVARWPGTKLIEYTVAESCLVPDDAAEFDAKETLPYYYIFIQLESSSPPRVITDDEKKMIDEELRVRNGDFERLRREGGIAIPRVYSVRPGGFEALTDYIIKNTNATPSQYKIPQKLRSFPFLQIMMEHSV